MRGNLGVLLACGAVGACASPPPPVAPPPQPPPITARVVASTTYPQPVARPPGIAADPCHPLAPNEVSEDTAPSVAGTTGTAKAGDWLEARGVSKGAFRAFIKSHDPPLTEDFDADTLYDNEDSCWTLKVGDKAEDALVCRLGIRTSIMRESALVFVVRNKRIVPVLEVGYALPAMDWPDMRWLDLQLAFAPGGLEADLHDRAPPGSVYVRSERSCHEHYQRYVACEKAHQAGKASQDLCPVEMDAHTRQLSFGHWPPAPGTDPMGTDAIKLHGCADALKGLEDLVKQTDPKDMYLPEFRADRAFAVKACNARGHYVWKGDRFVRATPTK